MGEDTKKAAADYAVENHGTLFLFRPLTEEARENLANNVGEEAQWFGGALVVEHRYALDLAARLRGEGWVVE
jgi:hypothetical protein